MLQVIAGPAGRKQATINPFQNLKVAELNQELGDRGMIRGVLDIKKNKNELDRILKNHLSGTARPPALCFKNSNKSMHQLNLQNYEIAPIEPLHDTKGHIKNVWDVLSEVLEGKEKEVFLNTLKGCYGNKDKVRGCDYRLSTIVAYNNMKKTGCSEDTLQLLYTLSEINRLAYLKALERSPRYILRLYNITFQHAMLCFDVLGKSPKKITKEKLYGIYFHSLINHLPQTSRLVSPSSLHTENEERLFSVLNSISATASSRNLESVRDNSIIRIQAEKKFQEKNGSTTPSSYSKISKFSKSIGKIHKIN